MTDRPRVVVTGLGALTPLGRDTAAFAEGLFAGRSGITRWKRDWGDDLLSRIGGDMSDFSLLEHLAASAYPDDVRGRVQRLCRATHFASTATSVAALEAWSSAGLLENPPDGARAGHVSAAHNVCMPYIAQALQTYAQEPEYVDPLFGMMSLDTEVVAATSELLALRGPSFLVGGACASGNIAVIAALDLIRAGRADVVVVTGAPIALEPVALQGWAIIDALSYRSFNEDPERASRPFDLRREGFVPSEGAAAVVLESLTHARARDAAILAEILGGASASDASRMAHPHQEGQERAMRAALADARTDAADIDYVNAHATSTPTGDRVEVQAVQAVLGGRRVPMNATKSMTGHCLTAAGVVEIVATIIQLRRGLLHPTINHDEPDPELAVDCVPNVAREQVVTRALSNSFGFGGINSCVVIGSAP